MDFKKVLVILINVGLLYYFIDWLSANIDIAQFSEKFRSLPISAFVITVSLNLIILLAYSYRMSSILKLKFLNSLTVVSIGYGFNAVLPMRLGDILKIYLGKKLLKIPTSNLALSSFLEKIYDLAALSLLSAIVIIVAGEKYIEKNILFIIIFTIVILLVSGFIAIKNINKIERLINDFVKVKMFLRSIYVHLKEHNLQIVSIQTILIWIVNIIVFKLSFDAFIPDIGMGYIDTVIMILIVSLAISIPSTPAGIGVVEAGIVAYLVEGFGVSKELALATALGFHLSTVFPHVITMVVMLSKSWIKSKHRIKVNLI